jgi:hypothetical protein
MDHTTYADLSALFLVIIYYLGHALHELRHLLRLAAAKFAEAMQATFETSEYQDFNEQNNLTPMEISGDEVVAQLEEDKQRYADLVEEYGIDLGDAS